MAFQTRALLALLLMLLQIPVQEAVRLSLHTRPDHAKHENRHWLKH